MTNLYTTLNLNSFNQAPVRGLEDEKLNLNKMPVKVIVEDNNFLSAGDLVKVVAGGSNLPTIKEAEATDTNNGATLYGFIPLTRKANTYNNNDISTIDLEGSVMYMLASETLTCGEAVYYDARSTEETYGKIVKAPEAETAGLIKCGFALNNAVADNLVRVYIKF